MISDNKDHITYSAEDIQRYWNGQLSPQEMHAMEKAALDDPFLADAMEGMGDALREHDEQLVNVELTTLHRQLRARVNTQDRPGRVVAFVWWKVAAVAVVVVVAGFWIFDSSKQRLNKAVITKLEEKENKENAAELKVAQDSSAASVAAPSDSTAAPPPQTLARSQSAERSQAEPGFSDFSTKEFSIKSTDSGDVVFQNNYNTRSKQNPLTSIDTSKIAKALAQASALSSLKKDSVQPATEVITLDADALAKRPERQLNQDVKLQNVIKGVVTDNRNMPLANANIMFNNRNATVTDPSGNFKFVAPDSVVNVSVSLSGYATQNFRLRSNHDGAGMANGFLNNNIQLQPNNAQLSEVVVTGYGKDKPGKKESFARAKSKGEEKSSDDLLHLQAAEPVYGWLSFNQYIEKNKRIPADNPNLVGEVVLSFAVNKRGELSDFKIEKSLSPQHDEEVERLVRQGPAWKLRVARKSRVTVIVRF